MLLHRSVTCATLLVLALSVMAQQEAILVAGAQVNAVDLAKSSSTDANNTSKSAIDRAWGWHAGTTIRIGRKKGFRTGLLFAQNLIDSELSGRWSTGGSGGGSYGTWNGTQTVRIGMIRIPLLFSAKASERARVDMGVEPWFLTNMNSDYRISSADTAWDLLNGQRVYTRISEGTSDLTRSVSDRGIALSVGASYRVGKNVRVQLDLLMDLTPFTYNDAVYYQRISSCQLSLGWTCWQKEARP